MNLKDKYVSVKRAAELRGVKPPRIVAMVNDGDLTRIEYDGGYVLERAEVVGYVRKQGGRQAAKKGSAKKTRKKK